MYAAIPSLSARFASGEPLSSNEWQLVNRWVGWLSEKWQDENGPPKRVESGGPVPASVIGVSPSLADYSTLTAVA